MTEGSLAMLIDDIKQNDLTPSERDVLMQDAATLGAHGRERPP